jgi:hypothetical protein
MMKNKIYHFSCRFYGSTLDIHNPLSITAIKRAFWMGTSTQPSATSTLYFVLGESLPGSDILIPESRIPVMKNDNPELGLDHSGLDLKLY